MKTERLHAVSVEIGCYGRSAWASAHSVTGNASGRIIRESAISFWVNLVVRRSTGLFSLPTPSDSPSIVIPGPDPDRILLIGSGLVTGSGVASHALGAGGHLARFISAETVRGVALDVVPIPSLLIRFAPLHLAQLDLRSYNALILVVGLNDAFIATSRRAWRRGLEKALVQAKKGMAPRGRVFLVLIADPTQSPLFRNRPARWALARGRVLNLESRQVIKNDPDVTVIGFEIGLPSGGYRLYDSSSYLRWARQLGPQVVGSLLRSRSGR